MLTPLYGHLTGERVAETLSKNESAGTKILSTGNKSVQHQNISHVDVIRS